MKVMGTIDPGTFDETDLYFHYDQVGSVMMASNSAGTLQTAHHQDAWGNVMNDWQAGLWASASGQAGWHHNTKATDGDLGLVYMYQSWYGANLSTFASMAPYPVGVEHPYSFAAMNPNSSIDPAGEWLLPVLGALPLSLALLPISFGSGIKPMIQHQNARKYTM